MAEDEQQPELLMRWVERYSAGDRSPALLRKLNNVAFFFFHDPWEGCPTESPGHLLDSGVATQGRLPIDDDENNELEVNDRPDSSSQSPDCSGLVSGLLHRLNRHLPAGDHPIDPLWSVKKAIETMGGRVYFAPGYGLRTDLAFHSECDGRSHWLFRIDEEREAVELISRSDLAYSSIPASQMEELCQTFNSQESGVIAKIFQPESGARPRLWFTASIPFTLTHAPNSLVKHLWVLFDKDLRFWKFISSYLCL